MLTNRRTQVNTSESFNLTLNLINVLSLGLCTGKGLTVATSAPGLGASLPHLLKYLAQPLPDLHEDWANPCHFYRVHRYHVCAGTGRICATSPPGCSDALLAGTHGYSRVLTGTHGHHTTPHPPRQAARAQRRVGPAPWYRSTNGQPRLEYPVSTM